MKQHVEQMWYVRRRGEQRGPFPAGLISRYLLLGRLELDDQVSLDRREWLPVRRFPQLIPEVMREVKSHPQDPVAIAQFEAARRWADDRRMPHRGERVIGFSRRKAYLVVAAIVAVIAAVPFLIPQPPAIQEPQCSAAAAPGVVWRDCRLAGSELANANLQGAVLTSADLRGSVLRAANLAGADLSYANLGITKLRGANLAGAQLIGADLRGSELVDTNLREANLTYADLTGADLTGADLTGAHLDHAIWADGIICLPGSIGSCRQAHRSP